MYAEMSPQAVLDAFDSASTGISTASVQQRRQESGWNRLPRAKRSVLLLFLRQFHDVLIYILLGALALSLGLRIIEGVGSLAHNIDIAAIVAILLLNAILGFAQEFRAEQAMESLRSLTSPSARVRRDGSESLISSEELVPGDVVVLEMGDRVSADGRLIETSHLEINESSLTGESMPVHKSIDAMPAACAVADCRCMVFAGTLVTGGSGVYVVTAIGLETQIGTVAKLVSAAAPPPTPLQQRMKRMSAAIGVGVVGLCGALAALQWWRGVEPAEVVLLAVSLAVSAVPEGLPAVVTASLAMGVRRMVKLNALVRRIDSLETLGSVTVICSDKTGTITENRMRVVRTWLPKGEKDESLLIQIAASCNRARLPDLGDPTEIGLLKYAEEEGVTRLPLDEEEVPFTSEQKYMQTRHGDQSFLKGAPEKIIALTGDHRSEEIMQANAEMASQGLRVLAAAVAQGGSVQFVGLIGMEDPPRAAVTSALQEAHDAGIRTVMITGDNLQTAKAIAERVGIQGSAVEGAELDAWTPRHLREMVKTVSVYARVSPVHKLTILKAMQENGEVVAMTGDGVNDAPALKTAHVGVAMGRDGTQVARDAGSLILTDDNYATIVAAVREGRRIYDNIRKFVFYLVRANVGQLLLITLTVSIGLPLPLLPLHILWINLMTDGLPALALGMENAEPEIMQRPPRNPRESLFAHAWSSLAFTALFACLLPLLVFLWALSRFDDLQIVRAYTFTFSILLELILAFVSRSRLPLYRIGYTSNPWLMFVCVIPLLLHILILSTPVRIVFGITPLPLMSWMALLGLGIGCFMFLEAAKWLIERSKGEVGRISHTPEAR